MTAPQSIDVGAAITALLTEHEVIDLSVPLSEELPCTWPGHMPFRATVWGWFGHRREDPQPVHPRTGGAYQTRWLVLDEHTGTHIDAPRHFVPPEDSGLPNAGAGGAIGVDALPLLAATGPADVVDVATLTGTGSPGESPAVTPEHLDAWEAEHGPVRAGDVVLLRTGWDNRFLPGPDGDRYGTDVLIHRREPGWPAPTPAAVDWMHERGVRCAGTDGLSIGPASDGGPTHLAGLTRHMTFVEALTGLGALPPRGAWFLFLPIRLVDGTGGPGRAIAVIPAGTRPSQAG